MIRKAALSKKIIIEPRPARASLLFSQRKLSLCLLDVQYNWLTFFVPNAIRFWTLFIRSETAPEYLFLGEQERAKQFLWGEGGGKASAAFF